MEYICELRNIKKNFGGVKALRGVHLEVRPGEIHGVVGENGAGKSTLMNVMSGVFPPSEGEFLFEGKPVNFSSTHQAHETGIAMIHQELSLAPELTVAENIFSGKMIANKLGIIDGKKMNEEAVHILERLHVHDIKPSDLIKDISISNRQLVEIAKAISINPKVLIMDEPTSSLTQGEVKFIINIMRELKKQGVAILFITHKLEEIKEVADRVTVLKDGETITTVDNDDNMTLNFLISNMVGRDFHIEIERPFIKDYSDKEVILEVNDLCVDKRVKNVSFKLHKGEILGLTGLVGAGRSELLSGIFGYIKKSGGSIKVHGREVTINNPQDAIRNGLGMVAEDRKTQGIYPSMSITDNVTSVAVMQNTKTGIINTANTKAITDEYVEKLRIKTPNNNQLIMNLSGGNQQKCIIARWMANNPEILLLDEPTHGIDVGAKGEIYKLVGQLAMQGYSIIFLSSELPEVLSICDRIMIMHHGELRATLDHDEASEIAIMQHTLEEENAHTA